MNIPIRNAVLGFFLLGPVLNAQSLTYPIVDTNQGFCYDNSARMETCPADGEAFYGQDAQYTGTTASYTDNGDGTITDNVTGLVWTQEISSYAMPWTDAFDYCESLETGGHTDWRLPTLKELWSIRDFSQGWPWIDTDYFYLVGDGSSLAQHHSWTSDPYLIESEYQNEQVEGDPAWIVNDWTGHIKAMSGNRFVRAVRGRTDYGINDFVDNGDATVTDNATGLMWSQDDSGVMLYWEEALAYAENATIAGYDDWRLPNIKELQSIADNSVVEIPAMDTSVFNLTEVTNTVYDAETGAVIDIQVNYPFYWSSTSNPVEGDGEDIDGGSIYAWFYSAGYNVDMGGYDLHGAGSICFGSKTLENSGIEDSVPIMVRLVRGGEVANTPDGDPDCINEDRVVSFPDGDTGMGGGGGDGPPDTSGPDMAATAALLGVTEQDLMDALGDPSQGEPDFAAAAAQLGVTEQELIDALSVYTYLGYPIEFVSDDEWINTDTWFGWLMVTSRPWLWSEYWTCWMYLNAEDLDAEGSWFWLMNEYTGDSSGSPVDAYLGCAIQDTSDGQWIDTDSWIGWLEVSDAPWVYPESAQRWIYLDESVLTDSGIWFWMYNP